MQLHFKKGRDGPSTLACVRPDGSRTWQRQPRGLPEHDLAHFAVESTLGLADGFFGLLARGHDLGDFAAPEIRRALPPETAWTEHVVGMVQTDLGSGLRRNADELNADLAGFFAGQSETCPRVLDTPQLDAIRRRLEGLLARWHTLPPGHTLTLVFLSNPPQPNATTTAVLHAPMVT
ncbi:MAG: hypothetical protein HY303_16015 [Candidatus Wallbacteria bacterium]|nr:hypothetical protein [Candidatus Wallbacteria bacterium]